MDIPDASVDYNWGRTNINWLCNFSSISPLGGSLQLIDPDHWFWLTMGGGGPESWDHPPVPATWRKPIGFFFLFFPFLSLVGIPSQRCPIMTAHSQKGKLTFSLLAFFFFFTEGLFFTSWNAYPRSTNLRLIFPPCTTSELDALSDLGPLAPSRIYTHVKKTNYYSF